MRHVAIAFESGPVGDAGVGLWATLGRAWATLRAGLWVTLGTRQICPVASAVWDPVVLPGAQLSTLSAVKATDVVAFAVEAWQQIPVQVDERLVQDFCEIYGRLGRWTSNRPARPPRR